MSQISLRDLVLRNRSYRRFDSKTRIPATFLRSLVGLARLAPTGGNLQSLRFRLINRPADCSAVFQHLAWAGYLKDWPGPAESERPTAYVVILNDTRIRPAADMDAGIAAQTMMLGAVEAGLGGCMIGSISRGTLSKKMCLPQELQIVLILALGQPVETVMLSRVKNNDIRYWRDAGDVHHVPKRSLRDLIV